MVTGRLRTAQPDPVETAGAEPADFQRLGKHDRLAPSIIITIIINAVQTRPWQLANRECISPMEQLSVVLMLLGGEQISREPAGSQVAGYAL